MFVTNFGKKDIFVWVYNHYKCIYFIEEGEYDMDSVQY